MSKQKTTEDLIKAIEACAASMNAIADCLKAQSGAPAPKAIEKVKEPEPEKVVTTATTVTETEVKTPTFEEVRKVLAGISSQNDGKYKSQVKDLVGKYSMTETLKGVPEESYAALVAEAEEIVNA